MFNEKSSLVSLFLSKVNDGTIKKEDVPALSNLKEVVLSLLSD